MSRAAELTLQNLQLPTALRERRCKLALGSHHLNGSRHQSPLQFPIVHFLYTICILSLMQKHTCYLIFDYCSDLYRFFCIAFIPTPFFYTHYSHNIHISSAVISMLSVLFFASNVLWRSLAYGILKLQISCISLELLTYYWKEWIKYHEAFNDSLFFAAGSACPVPVRLFRLPVRCL